MPNNAFFRSFSVCHRVEDAIEAEGTTPIIAGAADTYDGRYLTDSVGDNISEYNDVYNEMTAIYWIWKHYHEIGSPEYFWLEHYRRRFVPRGEYSYYEAFELGKKELESVELNDNIVSETFADADFIAPCPTKVRSVGYQYAAAHCADDLTLISRIIDELTPEYSEVCKEYFEGDASYLCNMFAFDKDTFFRYAEWIFTILDEFVKRRTSSGRLFVSERLTGIFFLKLVKEGKRVRHLPIMLITGEKGTLSACIKAFFRGLKEHKGLKAAVKPLVYKLMPHSVWLKRKRRIYFYKNY